MNLNARLLMRAAMVGAAVTLGISVSAAPAVAQSTERCTDLYNRVIELYQAAPFSTEYGRTSAYYVGRCLTSSAASPAVAAPYQVPYEQQPVALFSGQIVVDGIARSDDGDRDDGGRKFR
jgi:hypothetical protein